jgi:hypothetical protein
MADQIDEANELALHALSIALAAARSVSAEQVEGNPSGQCWNCLEPLAEGDRFCDADCRDDWQLRKNYAR